MKHYLLCRKIYFFQALDEGHGGRGGLNASSFIGVSQLSPDIFSMCQCFPRCFLWHKVKKCGKQAVKPYDMCILFTEC